jgi:hypothetical protein
MALNDGYAVDAQGRRIYFPPIGQPRLVPSTLDEAKLNGAVFTYGGITLGLTFVGYATASAYIEESAGYIFILALPLIVHYLAASLLARRWPALDNPNYTYHRFVVSTLRRQGTAWLRCKLIVSAILTLGLVLVAGSAAFKLQSEWAVTDDGKNIDRLVSALGMLVVASFCAIHAYRIHLALRRQKDLGASGVRGEAPNSHVP